MSAILLKAHYLEVSRAADWVLIWGRGTPKEIAELVVARGIQKFFDISAAVEDMED